MKPILISVVVLLAVVLIACSLAPPPPTETPPPTEMPVPTPTQAFPPTATPSAVPTPLPAPTDTPSAAPTQTPTLPLREIVLMAPEAGATVSSPVEVRGRVSVMPFEANLRGRVYDAQGRVVGEGPIQAMPDVEGDLGGPGSFFGSIPFQADVAGPGRVEIADISAVDGSIVVSATAVVTLTSDIVQ